MKTGKPVRREKQPDKPPDVPGHVWVVEDDPNAGSCEAVWDWVLYAESSDEK